MVAIAILSQRFIQREVPTNEEEKERSENDDN
jgi:hypothetical protein